MDEAEKAHDEVESGGVGGLGNIINKHQIPSTKVQLKKIELAKYMWSMGAKELLKEINRLLMGKRMLVNEGAIRSIRKEESRARMAKAAQLLKNEYESNEELTAFVNIDFDNFYEDT